MKKVWITLSMAVLIMSFQNCSNTATFEATSALQAKAGDAVSTLTPTSGDYLPPSNDDASPSDDSTPSVVSNPPATMPPSDSYVPPSDDYTPPAKLPPVVSNPPLTLPPPGSLPPWMDDSDDGSRANLQFVCVLRGSGKSVKVAISSGALGGKTGTPGDVCMSENACLNILSKSFDVASAERRGFCPDKNPHVVSMTDLEIQAALAKTALLSASNP